jgi:hypothetical protein
MRHGRYWESICNKSTESKGDVVLWFSFCFEGEILRFLDAEMSFEGEKVGFIYSRITVFTPA